LTHGDDDAGLMSLLGTRQMEILQLIADGLSNLEIADRLFISEATVKWHVRQILRKLGVSNRAQAVATLLGQPPG
jgi:DNA-binding NarL/FixJ family response regulator